MSYNKNVVQKTRLEFSAKQQRAVARAETAKQKLYAEIDGLRELDALLGQTLAEITIEIAKGEKDIDARISALRDKNLDLQKKRAQLLEAYGYPADYTDIKYECEQCKDTGYIGVEMCECLKKALAHNTILESGIGHLIEDQTFESFRLDYYSFNSEIATQMTKNYNGIKNYAETFSPASSNLLLIGKTGLGKTHLSTAIAKTVIEKGYNVYYETMQNIMSDFEFERFGRGYNNDDGHHKTDKYYECDLLIIDDLGTEIINNFTVSCLYNLLNTRINNRKPMIINSNLSSKEFREKYDERITSRILGEFEIFSFTGKDVRSLKLYNRDC